MLQQDISWSKSLLKAHSSFAPSQWKTVLLCNDVYQRLSTKLESPLIISIAKAYLVTGSNKIKINMELLNYVKITFFAMDHQQAAEVTFLTWNSVTIRYKRTCTIKSLTKWSRICYLSPTFLTAILRQKVDRSEMFYVRMNSWYYPISIVHHILY